MRPTAWTGGAAAVAAVLATGGLFLDSTAAASAAAGLGAVLVSRAALFLWRVAAVADGLAVERRLERPIVRQGEPVGVVTRLAVPASPALELAVSDLPPASAVFDPREVRAVGSSVRYWVRLPVPGEVAFRGVRLDAADRFFSTTLALTGSAHAGTVATVLPFGAGTRHDAGEVAGAGERERERRSVVRGQGTRSYRPYRPGDDRALVDWKLSAKYGRYFVREPTGRAGGAPLVVVDLPPENAPGAAEVLSAAGEALGAAVREYGACSLLAVAGGEAVAFRDGEADLGALVRLLGPRAGDRVSPLYRARDPAALRRRQRDMERSAAPPARRVAAALGANLASREPTAFERAVDRALVAAEQRDVVVYSTGAGDRSHLALIGAAVRRRGRGLRVLLPRPDAEAVAALAPYGAVEAL